MRIPNSMVFYFILQLPWLIRAPISDCNETCGTVAIPFPFGIRAGCYNNSWFRVTCNETADGPKPFIKHINLELLGKFQSVDNIVSVNNPVTYLNCGDKGNNSITAPPSVHLQDTPFFFSSEHNVFGAVGCGNLATVFHNNQTNPIASCLQQRCADQNSKFGGCYAIIPENLASYTSRMTVVVNPGSNRCTSAFMFDPKQLHSSDSDLEFLYNMSIDTTHVPATLMWNPIEHAAVPLPHKSTCMERCGNIVILFPFGIKAGCYMNEWFRVTCNNTVDGPKPFIRSINMQLLNVSVTQGTVVVNNSVTYFNCLGNDVQNNGVSVNLSGTHFSFSYIFNRFVSVGCNSLATFLRSPTDDYPIRGCLQSRCGNIVTSNFSCTTDIPPDLTSFAANMEDIYTRNGKRRSCGSAFIADSCFLESLKSMDSDRNGTSDWNRMHVPTTLQWGTPKDGQCELRDGPNTFCTSSNGRYCWASLSQMHLCVCTLDVIYPYYYHSTYVCQESGACHDLKYKYCYMICLNAPGNNCSSSCPDGYKYSSTEDMCKPVNLIRPSVEESESSLTFSTYKIVIITMLGTIFALIGTWYLYLVLERRKNIKLKQKYFKRNGGLLLQQQLSNSEGNVEKIRLFASKELEKATDYYNENRILGRGGQGTVYKGMLTDGRIVAVKKSIMVENKRLDEKELEQFINEVLLLSQINHRNVVKLLGCCLETQVPLVVYEFIPNGTLCHLIHEPNEEFPLTWEMRLRIAVEIANALSYLHSASSVPIYHRDIKSSNILLDDKYRAKSDVYSFGVVLVELITGQKPISSSQSEDVVRSLANFFLLSTKDNSVLYILDPMAMIAKLAKRCLNLNGKKRPTMKQVAMELERIGSSEEANAVEERGDEDSDIDITIEASRTVSYPTSSSCNDIGIGIGSVHV
ncbi:hypothetical protein V6N12_061263 [Hibiscus sabdariffa]|uniref:Protein kinase domain-containing protein n=1 Tax=Hibiscus sabdariffa TaxID=183260 RepID=A0ABR2DX41_9ROSI